MVEVTKRCTGPCGRELPATTEFFNRHKKGKYGLRAICKMCSRAKHALYRYEHREQRRAYVEAHREEIREYRRTYYAEHREKAKSYNAAYHSAHRKEMLAYAVRRRERNPGRITPERRASFRAGWHRRRARKLALPNMFTASDLQRAHEYWGGLCPCCGKQVYDLFGEIKPHADHWIPLTSPDCPGTVPWNMLILCSRCNLSKNNKEPRTWVIEKFGKRQGAAILKRIDEYFAGLRP